MKQRKIEKQPGLMFLIGLALIIVVLLVLRQYDRGRIERVIAAVQTQAVQTERARPTVTPLPSPTSQPTSTSMPTSIALPSLQDTPWSHYDLDGDGRVSCDEAREFNIAPVCRGHPVYPYMRDADDDGIVCETLINQRCGSPG